MSRRRTVFAQVLGKPDPHEFRRCAEQDPMPRDTPALSAYDHLAAMGFG